MSETETLASFSMPRDCDSSAESVASSVFDDGDVENQSDEQSPYTTSDEEVSSQRRASFQEDPDSDDLGPNHVVLGRAHVDNLAEEGEEDMLSQEEDCVSTEGTQGEEDMSSQEEDCVPTEDTQETEDQFPEDQPTGDRAHAEEEEKLDEVPEADREYVDEVTDLNVICGTAVYNEVFRVFVGGYKHLYQESASTQQQAELIEQVVGFLMSRHGIRLLELEAVTGRYYVAPIEAAWKTIAHTYGH